MVKITIMGKRAFLFLAIIAFAGTDSSMSFGRLQQSVPPKKPKPQSEEPLQSDETIRLGTELVNVLFTAIDRTNRLVSDIRKDDITILEDGKPQKLFSFRRESNLPVNIAFLLDLSGSQEYTFPQQKMAASEFLRSVLRPGKDYGAILTFQDDVDLVQGLTSKIDLLNRGLDEVEYSRRRGTNTSRSSATALYDALYITVDEVLGREEIRASSPDGSITRRAIILLTDGVDNASSRKLSEAIDRAWRSGVMVYALGIGDRFRFEGVREDILKQISDETGGRAYFPHSAEDLTASFHQIENDLRSQYLASYEPSNIIRDGSFRRIEVRLANRSDIRLIYRQGYYAPVEQPKKGK